jgi:hypothetical protein
MRSRIHLFAILVVIGLLATACGGSKTQATATPEPTKAVVATKVAEKAATVAPTKPANTPVPTQPAAAKPTNTPAGAATKVVSTPEGESTDSPDLISAVTGLENLKTYRTKMSIEIAGIKDDKPITGTYEISGTFSRDQKASAINISSSGTVTDDTTSMTGMSLDLVQIDKLTWVRFGDQWIQSSSDESQVMQGMTLSPKEIFGDLKGLQRVQPDQKVNGTDSRHYRFDDKTATALTSQAFSGMTTYQGEMWIAKGDAEYIVRMVMQGSGAEITFAETLTDATVTFTYDVYDVNTPITIEPPTSAALTLPGFAEGELPVMEGAAINLSMANMVIMQADQKPEDVVKFYQESLTKLGWEADGDPMVTADISILKFKKDNVTLNIMITIDENTKKTAITLTTQEEQ